MPEKPTFVVNDRRKFNAEGELRHDLPTKPSAASSAAPVDSTAAASAEPGSDAEARRGPQLVSTAQEGSGSVAPTGVLTDQTEAEARGRAPESAVLGGPEARDGRYPDELTGDEPLPPGPTAEESAEATRAYDATVDRLDTALRATDPGGERMPEMSFERLTQSLYTQALLLLGGAAQPGENPRVDILGARQTIDMLAVLADKTKGNLTPDEDRLLQSALFDLRMGFLEITQALARQAAQRQPGAPGAPPPGGPRIVR